MTGYLASITAPPPAFFAISRGRVYYHHVASITDGVIKARCGSIGEVGAAVTSDVVLEGLVCPECERSK